MRYLCIYKNASGQLATRYVRQSLSCRRDEIETELRRICRAAKDESFGYEVVSNDVSAVWSIQANKQQGAVDETVWA